MKFNRVTGAAPPGQEALVMEATTPTYHLWHNTTLPLFCRHHMRRQASIFHLLLKK
jgi:hypothetical protein